MKPRHAGIRAIAFDSPGFGLSDNPTDISAGFRRDMIPKFIDAITAKNIRGAYDVIAASNLLAAVCGRVCPQESQCEEVCTLGKKHLPVAIGKLERFVADYEMKNNLFVAPVVSERREEKVAIVDFVPVPL